MARNFLSSHKTKIIRGKRVLITPGRLEKGMITEEGLMNIASDVIVTPEGISLAPNVADNSLTGFVNSILEDYGSSINDLDNVVENIIPGVQDAMLELQNNLTPAEIATLLTPGIVLQPQTREIVRETLNQSPVSEQLLEFFDTDHGFVEFTRYIGTFVTIPTISEIDNIASLDPCALVEDPFMLGDMRAQHEALKESNKKNLIRTVQYNFENFYLIL